MCGIFGIISEVKLSSDKHNAFIKGLQHRGPDSNGHIYNNNKNILIGNTRLSIVDIENGQQPISDNKKRIHVVQNGEIYNYIELRDLYTNKGYKFVTKSDTEVLLAGYKIDGISFINKLNGMFSISIIDEENNITYLIRDRLGVKPLYYIKYENSIYFSSEIKPIIKLL